MTHSSSALGRASASAPGTCGELAQGMLDGVHFMITCPIDMYSVATVELSWGEGGLSAPPDSPKAGCAVRATLDCLGATRVEARLWLDSRLPRGKGMASSTADVSAAIVATAAAMSEELSPNQIAEIALGIEPSDGVMFPNIAMFDHRQGRVARTLGKPPPMSVVILDFGGGVDTLEFNRVNRDSVLRLLEPEMVEAVSLIEDGIRGGDSVLIGRGATLSALANQKIMFNPHLESALELSERAGAVGVNVAHSGAVIGMLFPDDAALAERAVALAWRQLPGLVSVLRSRIVSGGMRRR